MSIKAASNPASPMISTICGSAMPPTWVPSARPPSLSIRFTRFSFMRPSREWEPYWGRAPSVRNSDRRSHWPSAARPRRSERNRFSLWGGNDEGRMSNLISEETMAFVKGVAAEARRVETPCGDGHMIWHVWGDGPPLALLHGGYGSWTHWIRNVIPLSQVFTVAAPDLPGLGESATPPEPHTAEGLARIIVEGLDIVFGGHAGLHIAGFSFGGVLGGHVAAQLGDRVRTFTIVGSNGLGLVRQPTELRRLPEGASKAEALAVARHNLAALMIADRGKINDLAV